MDQAVITSAVTTAFSASQQPPRILLTVRQFSDKHPAFTQGAIRNLIF